MREIIITEECLEYIEKQNIRVEKKFFHLVNVIGGVRIVNKHFVKKITNTIFYELKISVLNEYRIVLFALTHDNFMESEEIICLCGFMKKSKKDYVKAVKKAEKILNEYLKNKEDGKSI